jgi:hypothetical protein
MSENQDQSLIRLITGRQTKLESDKVNFNERMQDVADYVCPHREDIRGTLQKGEKKGSKIFDGTAVGAAVLATDGIHGYHVSPAFPWFKYQMNRKKVNQVPAVREWLDEIEFNMYMALTRSNFYSEMWPYIYDGFTIGTAPIYPEEDLAEGRIIFEAVHPGEAFVAENKYGDVDIMHRKRKMSARQLVQMFGKENLTPVVTQAYDAQPFQEFEIIHAVFPREEYDDRMKDAKKKRFASCWYMPAGRHLCRVSGFDRFPYHVWRYMKSGKEPYGISPAMLAMADIKGVNILSKTLLGAAQLAVDPAYNVPSYLQGKVQLRPRGLNYIKEGTTDKISPVNTGKDFPVGIDREQSKQQAIKERFHVDTFLMLASLDGRGQRTAYEVSEMMAEKAAVLGAELGPLNTELDHILDHVYDIELAAGRMPGPPDILYELAEQDPHLRFDPVYMGPLAQAQRERFAKDGVRKFFMEIGPLVNAQMAAGQGSDLLDNFDLDEAGRYLADSNGIPAVMIRDKETVKAIRQSRTQAMQEAAQQEQMAQTMGNIKTASEADKNMDGQLSQGLKDMMAGGASAST